MELRMRNITVVLGALLVAGCTASAYERTESVLTGQVTDPTGAPVRAVFVEVEGGRRSIVRFTDNRGMFEIAGIPAGEVEVTVSGRGFAPVSRSMKINGQGKADFRIKPEFDRLRLTSAEILSTLPDNAETRWIQVRCVACHGLTSAEMARGADKSGWRDIFKAMLFDYGAEVLKEPDQAYGATLLEKYFGPGSTPPEEKDIAWGPPLSDEVMRATYRTMDLPKPDGKRVIPHSITADNRNGAWTAAAFTAQMIHWDMGSGEMKILPVVSGPHTPAIDHKGVVWTALPSARKMSIIDPAKMEVAYMDLDAVPHTLSTDRDGFIWGSGSKVFRIDPANRAIRYWQPGRELPGPDSYVARASLPGTTLPEIPLTAYHGVRDSKGILWYSIFETGGLVRLDPETGKETRIKIDGLGGTRGMVVDRDDIVWLTDWVGHRIVKYNPGTGKSDFYKLPTPYGMIYSIFTDDVRGYLWLADYAGNNLTRFDPKTEKFVEYPMPHLQSYPRFISVDSKGRVWFAESWNDRVGVLDPGYADTHAPKPNR